MTKPFKSLTPGVSLSDQVAHAIGAEIRASRLVAGDRLPTEASLVKQFGVSRTVVREAVSRLKSLGLIDHIVPEPPGGAHRDPVAMMGNLKTVLATEYARLALLTPEKRLSLRRERLAGYGAFKV